MGLLSDLAIWGMERGGLEGTIPTEVGKLTNLVFMDFDFNALCKYVFCWLSVIVEFSVSKSHSCRFLSAL